MTLAACSTCILFTTREQTQSRLGESTVETRGIKAEAAEYGPREEEREEEGDANGQRMFLFYFLSFLPDDAAV